MFNISYEHGELFRNHAHDVINIEAIHDGESPSFKEQCLLTAQSIYNNNSDVHVALTGGLFSQICLQNFIDAGIKPEVLIINFNNLRNSRDVTCALETCKRYGINPLIIEIIPTLFLETIAMHYMKKYQAYSILDMIVAYISEHCGISIIMAGEPKLRKDIHPAHKWSLVLNESRFWYKRFNQINKSNYIYDFFIHSSNQLLSYLNIKTVSELVNDKFIGKISTNSSRSVILSDIELNPLSKYYLTDPVFPIQGAANFANRKFIEYYGYDSRDFCIPIKDIFDLNGVKIWKFI